MHCAYVGAKLAMFGSSANGFGSKNSDLDICLTIPDQEKVTKAVYHFIVPWCINYSCYNVSCL